MSSVRRFVLLDRDGTLIEERHYLSDPEQVVLIPGAAAALGRLQAQGLGLVLITNQSGVGRGFFTRAQVEQVHRHLGELLIREGVSLDGIYYCPHTPGDACDCRKPAEGLALRAAQELDFELHTCFVVGDKACDIELGRRIGATTFQVLSGYGTRESERTSPDYRVEDLSAAAAIIGGWEMGDRRWEIGEWEHGKGGVGS